MVQQVVKIQEPEEQKIDEPTHLIGGMKKTTSSIKAEKLTNTNLFNTSPLLFVPKQKKKKRKKKNCNSQFAKFLDIFMKLNINLPFAEALEKKPNYIRFMKELLLKKKKEKNGDGIPHRDMQC